MIRAFLYFLFFFSFSIASAQWVKTTYIPNGSVESMAVCGDTVVVGSQSGGIYLSADNGVTWVQVNSGLPSNNVKVTALACDGSTFYAGVEYSGFYISSDGGISWSAFNNGLPSSIFLESIVISGDSLFLATDQGVYFSSDKGANWSAVNTGLTDLDVRSIGIIGQNIFAGTYNDGLFLSAVNSINWKNVNNSFKVNKHVICYAGISNRIFVGTGSGIYYSDDNGVNWAEANTGITSPTITGFVINGNDIIAGLGSNDGGILKSYDLGATWNTTNDGFPQYPYVSALVNNTSTIFAGGPDNGSVWLRPLSQITFVENSIIPLEYSLSQNYPNPFNPNTVINFSIPKDAFVTLKVYNLQGEEVETLVSERLVLGHYSEEFNAERFASGIYFYTLTSGNNRITNKMILLK